MSFKARIGYAYRNEMKKNTQASQLAALHDLHRLTGPTIISKLGVYFHKKNAMPVATAIKAAIGSPNREIS